MLWRPETSVSKANTNRFLVILGIFFSSSQPQLEIFSTCTDSSFLREIVWLLKGQTDRQGPSDLMEWIEYKPWDPRWVWVGRTRLDGAVLCWKAEPAMKWAFRSLPTQPLWDSVDFHHLFYQMSARVCSCLCNSLWSSLAAGILFPVGHMLVFIILQQVSSGTGKSYGFFALLFSLLKLQQGNYACKTLRDVFNVISCNFDTNT